MGDGEQFRKRTLENGWVHYRAGCAAGRRDSAQRGKEAPRKGTMFATLSRGLAQAPRASRPALPMDARTRPSKCSLQITVFQRKSSDFFFHHFSFTNLRNFEN